MNDPVLLDESWLRHEKHFPVGGDIKLQILTGQLLVEQLLREIFTMQLRFPEALKGESGASFDSHEMICLVQAISPHSDKEVWVWDAAKRLNRVRNQLAHQLEPAALDEKINSLLKFVRNAPPIKPSLERLGLPEGKEIEAIVLAVCGCLTSLKLYLAHIGPPSTA